MSGFITRYTCLFSSAVILAFFGFASSALADQEVNSGIVNVPNSPIVLTACKMSRFNNSSSGVSGPVVIGNRTKHALAYIQIVYSFYDTENVRMYQTTNQYSLSEPALTGDTTTVRGGAGFSGTAQLLSRVTCRVQSADFSGNKHWKYGERWAEKLVPLTAEQATSPSDGSRNGSSSPPVGNGPALSQRLQGGAPPPFSLAPTDAWNDTVGGNLLVHVVLDVQGGASDSTLTPANLTLTMALANGGNKQYAAMPVAAPTFQKLNPLGNTTTTAYEVDPKEDLGRLGSIIKPAHGNVKVVATFLIGTDVVANANDNRQIRLK